MYGMYDCPPGRGDEKEPGTKKTKQCPGRVCVVCVCVCVCVCVWHVCVLTVCMYVFKIFICMWGYVHVACVYPQFA